MGGCGGTHSRESAGRIRTHSCESASRRDKLINNYPERSQPAHLPVKDSVNRTTIIFLTICSKNRNPIFAHEEFREALLSAWLKADRWMVGRYVLMPDHLHLFCSPVSHPLTPLRIWIKYWKGEVSKVCSDPDEESFWQKDVWDRQLRSGESYADKWAYVRNNPVRAGLVEAWNDWPYQGEIHHFRWHD